MGNIVLRNNTNSEKHWGITPGQDRFDSGIGPTRNIILIVDSSAPRRRELVQIMGGLALEIVEAENTREAIAAIAKHRVDLLLIEFGLDGGALELCQTLKNSSATQFLPVLVIAQHDDINSEVRSIEAGADGFFAAPLRPRALRARIQAMLRRKLTMDSRDNPETVLISLAQSVEGRDPDLGQHCERLALMASSMGLALGLPGPDIVTLQQAAYLHDIGKVSIPDSILFKAGPLTPDEWEVMKSHPERGERICSNMRSLAAVLPVIRHHHEKWNGSGYPDSLKEENIPLLARILQLADIYDALTNSRCYKRAFTPEEAIGIMREEAQKGWRDPKLTEQFAELLPTFLTSMPPDLSCLSLHALARYLRQEGKNLHAERSGDPGLCNIPMDLMSRQ